MYGRALILDGIIQCTEKDEFSYQEMISFLPLCCHPNPENVLIVGGGDGGVAREVVKHPAVKHVHQVSHIVVVDVINLVIYGLHFYRSKSMIVLLICPNNICLAWRVASIRPK